MLLVAALALFALRWVQRRLNSASLPRARRISISAVLWLLFTAGCAYFAWPLLFLGPDDPNTSMYVQVPAGQKAGTFNDRLAAILRKQGLHPSSASISSTDASRSAMHVLEAQSALIRVWSQTMPLSRDEAISCGYSLSKDSFGANDQRQYLVAVTAIPFFSSRAEAAFGSLKGQLLRSGYGVSAKPLPCQSSA
jgi:hypothetical protein